MGCGTPSSTQATAGYECTGALFTAVDINTLNTLQSEAGCVAGMMGLATQLKGYHCLSFSDCPGANCKCEVREGCATQAASDTKACLYGVSTASECPADAPASAGPSEASSAFSRSSAVMNIIVLTIVSAAMASPRAMALMAAACLIVGCAGYNTSVTMCGTPSSTQAT